VLGVSVLPKLRVAVHRRLEGCMPQEFLHNLRVNAQRLDQSGERMPVGVPAGSLDDTGRRAAGWM
jgi:hypothetical protein